MVTSSADHGGRRKLVPVELSFRDSLCPPERFLAERGGTGRNEAGFELNEIKAIAGNRASCKGLSSASIGFKGKGKEARLSYSLNGLAKRPIIVKRSNDPRRGIKEWQRCEELLIWHPDRLNVSGQTRMLPQTIPNSATEEA